MFHVHQCQCEFTLQATHRPFDLDEAMYRRIKKVFQLKAPNYLERLNISELVTSHKAVHCDPSINWEFIALKYKLTGGFIKSAIISALIDGVGHDPKSPRITKVKSCTVVRNRLVEHYRW